MAVGCRGVDITLVATEGTRGTACLPQERLGTLTTEALHQSTALCSTRTRLGCSRSRSAWGFSCGISANERPCR
jgi:hypothetical protein